MQVSTLSPQAVSVDNTGGGIRATKIAQDQQQVEGAAAVELIESAGAVATAGSGGSLGQSIDVYA